MNGFWIILSASAGEIGREFAPTQADIPAAILRLADPLDDGDTIRIEAGEKED